MEHQDLKGIPALNYFIDNKVNCEKAIDNAIDQLYILNGLIPTLNEIIKYCKDNNIPEHQYLSKVGFGVYIVDYLLERKLVTEDCFKNINKTVLMINTEIKLGTTLEKYLKLIENYTDDEKAEMIGVTRSQLLKFKIHLKDFI